MFALEPIPLMMPAGVLESPRSLTVKDIPVWRLEDYGDPDMVLIKVAACGICGSDFRYFLGENPWSQHTLGRHIPNAPNIVLGHEYAGTVVAVLSENNRGLLGKRVAPICFKVCGACAECRAGRTRLCANTTHMGHGQGWGEQPYYPGAYAHYVLAWGESCFPIPDNIGFQEAAMMDILAVCVHVADQGRIQPGRPVLTIGAGPAGNGVIQAALAKGASAAVLLDRSSTAIRVAKSQGLGQAINTAGMVTREILDLVKPLASEGFGTVFDTVGTGESIHLGLEALGKAGAYVAMAVHEGEVPLNIFKLSAERQIVTSCNFETGDFPIALSLLEAGRFRVKEWLTATTLQELPGLFKRITDDPDNKGVFKLVVDPWA